MRVNIYHHEIPTMHDRGPELVETVGDGGERFHGIRFYTEPPIEHVPGDDDSGAVTFWVPWSHKGGHDVQQLREIFEMAINALNNLDV